ncbi:MAG: SCP2 sterol-binding domain-containing protein [Armatimonadetes bacterium]|nr:SCP2 sterol-binding domain-containing protein [Armatimonadota bacterium]
MNTCAEYFQTLPQRLKVELVAGWETCFFFDIAGPKGGRFTVRIKDQKAEVFPEKIGDPKCTVRTDDETYMGIERGRIKPEAAFMTGKIKIDNVGEMMKYASSFRRL